MKNLLIGLVVLALSSGIFFLLIKDQDVKNSILRSSLQMFGDDLLAMVPDGGQRDMLAKKFNEFVTKAENNEIPEEQVEVTLARALNMQLSPEKPTPEEWHAVFDAPIDSSRRPPDKRWRGERPPKGDWQWREIEADRFARNVQEMMLIKKEFEKLCEEDSVNMAVYKHVMFVADSGLQLLVDTRMEQQQLFSRHPDMQRRLEKMSEDDLVKFRSFAHAPDIAEQSLINFAPLLPKEIRAEIVVNSDFNLDTLATKVADNFLHPDSLQKFIEEMVKMAQELERSVK